MEIKYNVNKTFAQVHQDKAKFLFVRGPVGSGKSVGCIMHLFLHALRQRPDETGVRHSKYLVVRSTYPALKSTVLKSWISWFKDKIKIVMDIPIRATLRFPLSDGTSIDMEIVFLAVDSEQNIEKLRSLEVTGCHINEATEVDQAVHTMIKTRINRYPAKKDGGCVDPFIICDYNSPDTDHWLYRLAEEEYPQMSEKDKRAYSFYVQPPAVFYVNGEYYVNPEADNIENLDDDYYLDPCRGGDDDFIKVNLMNNYGVIRSGRPVYKDYKDDVHCARDNVRPLAGVPIIIGIDQGLTPSAVFVQQDPSSGRIIVLDEITTEDCSLQEFCNDVLWPRINGFYREFRSMITLVCDPATAQRSMNDAKAGTEIIRKAGFNYKLAKSNIAIMRREAVTHFLRMRDKFIISPQCKMLRKGFISEYKYDERRVGGSAQYKDVPAKNEYSHPHDALQYAVLEFYRKPKRRFNINRKKYSAASTVGGY